MKVLINITTYKRLDMLNSLLKHFKEFDVKIWDDASCYPIELIDFGLNATIHRFPINHGKKKAWFKFKKIFDYLKETDYDYYFFLPDDSEPCKDFVTRSIKLWEQIDDKKKISLAWASKDRLNEPCWTPHHPVEEGDVILTQWNDLQFMCEKRFFREVKLKEVNPKRWEKDPTLGSGVGSMISNQLCSNFKMYHAKEEMLKHLGNNESLMNPEIRKKQKL